MTQNAEINPTETYVLDDDELAELESTGLTGLLKGLADTPAPSEEGDPGHEEPER